MADAHDEHDDTEECYMNSELPTIFVHSDAVKEGNWTTVQKLSTFTALEPLGEVYTKKYLKTPFVWIQYPTEEIADIRVQQLRKLQLDGFPVTARPNRQREYIDIMPSVQLDYWTLDIPDEWFIHYLHEEEIGQPYPADFVRRNKNTNKPPATGFWDHYPFRHRQPSVLVNICDKPLPDQLPQRVARPFVPSTSPTCYTDAQVMDFLHDMDADIRSIKDTTKAMSTILHMHPTCILDHPLYKSADGIPIPYVYHSGDLADNIMKGTSLNYSTLKISKEAFHLYLPMMMDLALHATVYQVHEVFTHTDNPYTAMINLLSIGATTTPTLQQLNPVILGALHYIQVTLLKQDIIYTRWSNCPKHLDNPSTQPIPPKGAMTQDTACSLLDNAYKLDELIPRMYLINLENQHLPYWLPLTKQGTEEKLSDYILRQLATLSLRIQPMLQLHQSMKWATNAIYFSIAKALQLYPCQIHYDPANFQTLQLPAVNYREVFKAVQTFANRHCLNTHSLYQLIDWTTPDTKLDRASKAHMLYLQHLDKAYELLLQLYPDHIQFFTLVDYIHWGTSFDDWINQINKKPLLLGLASTSAYPECTIAHHPVIYLSLKLLATLDGSKFTDWLALNVISWNNQLSTNVKLLTLYATNPPLVQWLPDYLLNSEQLLIKQVFNYRPTYDYYQPTSYGSSKCT